MRRLALTLGLILLGCSPVEELPADDLVAPPAPADLAAGPDLPSAMVPRERGSLAELVDKEPTSQAAGAYKAPTAAEVALFREAMGLLLRGEGERAAPALAQVGYTVTDFTDDVFEPARPRRFYVVRERTTGRRYLGLYVLRRDPDRGQIFLEAPFGYDSFLEYVSAQAARTLLGADVGGMLVNTADRCASAETPASCIKCAGVCLRCRGVDRSYFPVSDMGHAEGTFFQAAHEVLAAAAGAVVLSLHGHTSSTAGYVVSDGTKARAAADALVLKVGRAYGTAAGVTVKSCNDGSSNDLCGDTLLQGRQMNGYMPLCSGTMPQGARRFVALQQLYDVRRADGTAGAGTRTVLARAIQVVWP